jgi:hypothetical protein
MGWESIPGLLERVYKYGLSEPQVNTLCFSDWIKKEKKLLAV